MLIGQSRDSSHQTKFFNKNFPSFRSIDINECIRWEMSYFDYRIDLETLNRKSICRKEYVIIRKLSYVPIQTVYNSSYKSQQGSLPFMDGNAVWKRVWGKCHRGKKITIHKLLTLLLYNANSRFESHDLNCTIKFGVPESSGSFFGQRCHVYSVYVSLCWAPLSVIYKAFGLEGKTKNKKCSSWYNRIHCKINKK